jgi:hypothetical protein
MEGSEMNSSSTSSSNAPLWRRILVATVFVAGLVAIFAYLNKQGGKGRIEGDIWFSRVAGEGLGHTADALFIGSSRVSAAIVADGFDQMMGQVLRRPIQSVNLGMGYSTTAEYVMGLKRLRDLNPEAIRGSVVFIEAPMGLPDYSTWSDTWLVDAAPELMSRYLTSGDLPRLFRSNTPTGGKLLVAANVLFGYDENITRIRRSFQSWLDATTLSVFSGLLPISVEGGTADLSSKGGIRTDKKGVDDAKIIAQRTIAAELADQRPRREWDNTTMFEVVQLLREMGAQPIFYEMPMSPGMSAIYQTPVRIQDRAIFQAVAGRWGVPYLKPTIATTEEDFPDEWHLRKSRAPEFTEALTREFLEKFVAPAMRSAQPAPSVDSTKTGA